MRFSNSVIRFLSFASIATNGHAAVAAEEGSDHDDLKLLTHNAYHLVEEACAADVEKFCPTITSNNEDLAKKERELLVPSSSYSSMNTAGAASSSDVFLDMILFSSTPSLSEQQQHQDQDVGVDVATTDYNEFMDQLFTSILLYSSLAASSMDDSGNTLYYSSPSSSFIIYEELTPTVILDYGVARLAAEKGPEEIPLLASQLQSYGTGILSMSTDVTAGAGARPCPYRTQMARRLLEMDTTIIPQIQQQYHVRLPFGPVQNTCLKTVFEQQKVSAVCASSITRLEKTFLVEEVGHNCFTRMVDMMALYSPTIALFIIMCIAMYVSYENGRQQEYNESNQNNHDDYYGGIYELYDDDDDSSDDDEEEEIDHDYYALVDETKNTDTTIVIYEGVPIQMV